MVTEKKEKPSLMISHPSWLIENSFGWDFGRVYG